MNKVSVIGIKTYAYHGCLEEEAKIGNEYIIDVELTTDFKESAMKDELSKTIDYVIVNRIVEEEMAIRSKLIETVGYRILERLKLEDFTLYNTVITIKKINPPINGNVDYVSITVEE
ncbi:MAG: dihydroneopterin aldolase [Urechidicola sp.]|jgi:dihydroneopterin aldolase|tara:strand:- start:10972 stop:11322 length:351 start_codon:yes stop_codon:yes gene_type:complete